MLRVPLAALAAGVALTLGVWAVVDRALGWSPEGVFAAVSFTASTSLALVGTVSQPLIGQWLSERRSRQRLPVLAPDDLEAWRTGLRQAVLEKRVDGPTSQLGQMVQQATVLDVPAARVGLGTGKQGEPRIRVGHRLRALPEITAEWDRSPSRLVILGEPGYGKTVAALALLAHINGTEDRPAKPVAELFSLAEWYAWEADHPNAPLADWLADDLVTSYPALDRSVARSLVARRLVVPILDGLDEVPARHRRRCKDAIDAYAGRTAPFRPFVVTCRAHEYRELAPDWVVADEQVGLVGLGDVDEVIDVLRERTSGEEWQAVRERLEQGDEKLARLLRSPLRLSVALQVYRDGGAGELLRLAPSEAEGRLWDRLLRQGSASFAGADAERVRAWLTVLATGMRRLGRQRFWLHELHLYAPDRKREVRRFTAVLGSIGSLVAAAVVGLAVRLLDGPTAAAWSALLTLVVAIAGWLTAAKLTEHDDDPSVVRPAVHQRSIPLRRRVLAPGYEIVAVLLAGLLVGWLGDARHGVLVGLWLGCLVVLAALVDEYWAGWRAVATDSLGHLPSGGPETVLRTSLRSGLAWGAVLGQFTAVVVAPIAAAASFAYVTGWGIGFGDAAPAALSFGLRAFVVVGLFAAVTLAVWHGVGPWLFHHWLRFRLDRQGLLPRRLPQFLDWCAAPQRAWLRGSGGYELRHRGLLDHLAPATDGETTAPEPSTSATAAADAARDAGATDGEPVRDLWTAAPRWPLGRLVLPAVPVVCAGVFGLVALGSLGPEFRVDYVAGDEPEVEERGVPPLTDSAPFVSSQAHVWSLEPGDDLRTTFRATPRDFLMPAEASVDHISGQLAVEGCDAAAIAWQVAVDGAVVAEGTLGPSDGNDAPTRDLSGIGLPGEGHPSTAFVLTGRRTDQASCTAQLAWHHPGFDAPALGSGG